MAKKRKQSKRAKSVKKTSKPGFSPIIALSVLVAIGVVVGGGMYYMTTITGFDDSSNPNVTVKTAANSASKGYNTFTFDPTGDWQTFTNNDYGFSLKYPSNWEGYKTDDQGNFFFSSIELGGTTLGVSIAVREISLEQYVSELESGELGAQEIVSQTSATLNGISGTKVLSLNEIGAEKVHIFIEQDEKAYIILYDLAGEEAEGDFDERIASTFNLI